MLSMVGSINLGEDSSLKNVLDLWRQPQFDHHHLTGLLASLLTTVNHLL